ncbi:MAG TPA: dienelactone hydrolase family protein [Anaerohalosphaeraceae bacterium]|nr:dienelactone hydrolase family protein [Anaerohalosphaeraceae bacterium]
MKLPENYTPDKEWPLLVTLHGLGDGPILAPDIESMVQIGPYGRGSLWYTGMGEEDVLECINFAKQVLAIDEDRIYLCGFSMGAIGTFRLGLRYPHIWAACVPVCGRCDDSYSLTNAMHVPFWIHAGSDDAVLSADYSRAVYKQTLDKGLADWKYTEHAGMGHSFAVNWPDIEAWLLTKKKVSRPEHVSCRTKQPGRYYWFELSELSEFGMIATVDARVNGPLLELKTDNVANYTIFFGDCPVDVSAGVRIVENGKTVFDGKPDRSGYFVKRREHDGPRKHTGRCGPLWDIYRGPCTLVYGTDSTDKLLVEAARSCAESFSSPPWMGRVTFPVIPDTRITELQIKDSNLVLFGNAAMNKVLARIASELPVVMTPDSISADGHRFTGRDIGFVLIYPNPLNNQRYVAVFAGSSADAMNVFDRLWPDFHSPVRDIDAGVFELVHRDNAVEWKLTRVFGSDWNWR